MQFRNGRTRVSAPLEPSFKSARRPAEVIYRNATRRNTELLAPAQIRRLLNLILASGAAGDAAGVNSGSFTWHHQLAAPDAAQRTAPRVHREQQNHHHSAAAPGPLGCPSGPLGCPSEARGPATTPGGEEPCKQQRTRSLSPCRRPWCRPFGGEARSAR